MFTIKSPRIGNIFPSGVSVNAESFGNLSNTLRSKRAFGINVSNFAACTAHFLWKLCDNGHSMG
ncbi:hypothetical protein BDV32DRAFT_119589 [Aspergillus pseudonomiae]|nr:hypothetical protein BDV32DRAFT_119589 [Aspergillus pseudonomiae]